MAVPDKGQLADFDYPLDGVDIAQAPPVRRGDSRLLVLERESGQRHHRKFAEIGEFLRPGDLLVLNDTRVFPARLHARRASGGRLEILLLEEIDATGTWEALGRPAKSFRPAEELQLEGGPFTVRCLGRSGPRVRLEFLREGRRLTTDEILAMCAEAGEAPLPPYIRRPDPAATAALDQERYQTVYAREPGAVAAPTAGLHFTEEILRDIRAAGVRLTHVTLHVGLGTFQPLTEGGFQDETLHEERRTISTAAGTEIQKAQREGRRVIAVGTTCVRSLESFDPAELLPSSKRTDIFIKPGHEFRNVDAVLTNFHLPRSSPLVLVAAFAGRGAVLDAYADAVERAYRFFSYGDAMLIV